MGKDISKVNCIIHFCDGGSCRKRGSEQVVREARAFLKNAGAWNKVHTIKTRCNGRCEDAPTWIVQPGNFWYKNLDPLKGLEILQSHLQENKPLQKYLLFQPGWDGVASEKEIKQGPVGFKSISDPSLGEILLLKMGSSEQVLYPLLKFIFSYYQQLEIQLPNLSPINLNQPPLVEYADEFDLWIKSTELEVPLAIAPIPQDAPAEIAERKVGLVELFIGHEKLPGLNPRMIKDYNKGLRLKNRKGKELLLLWFKDDNDTIWNHILKNYLEINFTEELINTIYEQK